MLKNQTRKCKNFTKGLIFGFYNSLITYVPFFIIRHFYLRKIIGIKLGNGSSVGIGCFISGKSIVIGENSVINRFCFLDGRSGIEIGNNVSISPNVAIISLTHDKDCPQFSTISKPVLIKDYVWVGFQAMVLPGVILNQGSIAGAGAVVTKNVPAYTVVGGNPAKVIGERSKELNYKLKYFPLFHSDECL